MGRPAVYLAAAMIGQTLRGLFPGQTAAALVALLCAGHLATPAEYTITAGGGSLCAPGSNIVVFVSQKKPARALSTRMNQTNNSTDQLRRARIAARPKRS